MVETIWQSQFMQVRNENTGLAVSDNAEKVLSIPHLPRGLLFKDLYEEHRHFQSQGVIKKAESFHT